METLETLNDVEIEISKVLGKLDYVTTAAPENLNNPEFWQHIKKAISSLENAINDLHN